MLRGKGGHGAESEGREGGTITSNDPKDRPCDEGGREGTAGSGREGREGGRDDNTSD